MRNTNSRQNIMKNYEQEIIRLKSENAYLQKEIIKERAKYNAIISSTSWKATSFIRRIFFYRRNLHALKSDILKTIKVLKKSGLSGLISKLKERTQNDYSDWVNEFDILNATDLLKISELSKNFKFTPKISILMPVYNSPIKFLKLAIESVLAQRYENWELCIADDKSTDPEIEKVLLEYQKRDQRIKVVFRKENGHISLASNSALEIATGEYIGLLDHDDVLREHALFMCVHALNENSNFKLIYSDEDKIDSEGNRFNPYFKTDWNPELMLSQNYLCHFTVIESNLFRKVGGFRKGCEGAQDWDLFLRVTEQLKGSEIYHIPHILYHWRSIPGSTAMDTGFKKYVYDSQLKAVREHLERTGVKDALVEQIPVIDQIRVTFTTQHNPLVSIIIPTKDNVELLRTCISTILQFTNYSNFEIIVIDNNSTRQETFSYFEELEKSSKIRVIKDPTTPFNYSKINNNAVKYANGELLCFLNNDIQIISGNWLTEMVSNALRAGVGAVGAKLLFPDDTIQHAGVILGIGGIAGHSHKCFKKSECGYFNRLIIPSNFSAVTAACLVVKKSIFEEVGGLDQENLTVAFNDVDFCLKVLTKGYLNIFTPYAVLYHHESVSRGHENTPEKIARFEKESGYMKEKWQNLLDDDPYYNKNLTVVTENFALSFPSRESYIWK